LSEASELEKEIHSLFPNYKNKELHKCNLALSKRAITLDAGNLSRLLLEQLQMKENFKLRCNAEVNSINYSRSTGLVNSVSILGKIGQEIKADAIVFCTGAHTARALKSTLGIYAPITPIKSYTFEVGTETQHSPTHLIFHNSALTASFVEPGMWRMSTFGDIAGLSLDFDNRRVRTAKNVACVSIDTNEGLMAQNMKAVLRACSPDDMPVVGALKSNPNIYVNSGHGGRNCALSIGSSKLVSELLSDGKLKSCDEPQLVQQSIAPLRFQM